MMQDMGMTWARTCWLVLVFNQVGYGERRLHREMPHQHGLAIAEVPQIT